MIVVGAGVGAGEDGGELSGSGQYLGVEKAPRQGPPALEIHRALTEGRAPPQSAGVLAFPLLHSNTSISSMRI